MASSPSSPFAEQQDFHHFATAYRDRFPDDVLTVAQPLSADQDITAVVASLAARGRHDMLVCERVDGLATPLVTNVFASRTRIGRLFGAEPASVEDARERFRLRQPAVA